MILRFDLMVPMNLILTLLLSLETFDEVVRHRRGGIPFPYDDYLSIPLNNDEFD